MTKFLLSYISSHVQNRQEVLFHLFHQWKISIGVQSFKLSESPKWRAIWNIPSLFGAERKRSLTLHGPTLRQNTRELVIFLFENYSFLKNFFRISERLGVEMLGKVQTLEGHNQTLTVELERWMVDAFCSRIPVLSTKQYILRQLLRIRRLRFEEMFSHPCKKERILSDLLNIPDSPSFGAVPRTLTNLRMELAAHVDEMYVT